MRVLSVLLSHVARVLGWGASVQAKTLVETRKKAEQGDAQAQYDLGVAYATGQDVPQDDQQAAAWFLKAAEQGNAWAQFMLGVMYENDRGVPQDDQQAAAWYLKAAEQGDADAQSNLSLMYDNGDGVPQDLARAYMWANLAAAQGHKYAIKNLDLIAKKLKPSQREEGQRLVREWTAKHTDKRVE